MLGTSEGKKAVAAAVAVAFAAVGQAHAAFDVTEKNVSDLERAYSLGSTTAVDVVQQYLDRIKMYDDGPNGVNAVGQINPNVISDAASVDALIKGGATTSQYPLLGVPFIIKDSYDVKGMITTNGVSVLNGSGTPGSTTMIARNDAFSVARLKAAGAIIIGKANMTTMAYAYDGLDNAHGQVKNPYQPSRIPGGSSSGSGAGTASNFAMMAMGGETGGSIRVPSNANALVGLKTSLGLIDPSGTWPLTPTRDVVGPIAKTVTDVAYAMNALVAPSATNLFNGTPMYPAANPGTVRPANYASFLKTDALAGKVIAVPRSMIPTTGTTATGGATIAAPEGTVNSIVLSTFNQALSDLKKQGAKIIYVDIPASKTYYGTIGRPAGSGGAIIGDFPYDYPSTVSTSGTTSGMKVPDNTWSSYAAAYYYEKQIEQYQNPTIKNLRDFATALDNGRNGKSGFQYSTLNSAYTNINALANIYEAGNAKGFGDDNKDGVPDNPDAFRALKAFAQLRTDQYESFMKNPNLADDPSTTDIDESKVTKIDSFVAPTYGTVVNYQRAELRPPGTDPYAGDGTASLLGRLEGNLLGAPSIDVPMGYAPDGTPLGIQFFDEFLGEGKLLGFAYDYEQATLWRHAPDLTSFAVPEPTSLAAIAVFAGMGLKRRRKAALA